MFLYSQTISARRRSVGEAEAALLDQPRLVDFAIEWIEKNRG